MADSKIAPLPTQAGDESGKTRIYAVRYNHRANQLASCSKDVIKVYSMEDGRLVGRLSDQISVSCMDWNQSGDQQSLIAKYAHQGVRKS